MNKTMLIFVFLSLLIFASFGLAENIKDDQIKKGIDEAVITELQESESVEVIIYADTEKDKRKVIKSIGEENVEHEFSSSHTIAANISKIEVEKLEKLANLNVEKERIFYAFLSESTGIVNANSVWGKQIEKINITGFNQSVCIIDTGVNYNHPDLGGCFGQNNASSNCKVIGGYDFVNDDDDPIDDNGHGTHVSGIAAANGSVKGVAPDAKIVAIKSLSSGGSGSDTDIIAGIEWCISNASLFNIVAISMSLGSDCYSNPSMCYTNYCDGAAVESAFREAVNKAFNANISVVVSSGNNGNTTAIPSPACLSNVTAVGATYDSSFGNIGWDIDGGFGDRSCSDVNTEIDKIVCFSNRNKLVKLFAPGVFITSTDISGGSGIKGGTSMSAPMVAGGVALLKQFLSETGQGKTPKEIEFALNATGRLIDDINNSGVVYSRIDLYQSLVSLDSENPEVSLISPADNYISLNFNQTFKCNATDLSLKNVSLEIWNSSYDVVNQTMREISGQFIEVETNLTDLDYGEYNWNCLYYDENSNLGYAEDNFTVIIGGISTSLLSPADKKESNSNLTEFSCGAISEENYELKNISLEIWNSSFSLIYSENKNLEGFTNSSTFNYTFINEDIYNWNCFSLNNNSDSSKALLNNSFIYDKTKPNITLASPAIGSSFTGDVDITFEFEIIDNANISGCNLFLNDANVSANITAVNTTSVNEIVYTVVPDNYLWKISCTDVAGNSGNSSSRSFSVSSESSDSGGGDSSGSGSSGSESSGGGGSSSSSTSVTGNTVSINEQDSNETEEISQSPEEEIGEEPRAGITGATIFDTVRDHSKEIGAGLFFGILISYFLFRKVLRTKSQNIPSTEDSLGE